jgi:hypothetical protein
MKSRHPHFQGPSQPNIFALAYADETLHLFFIFLRSISRAALDRNYRNPKCFSCYRAVYLYEFPFCIFKANFVLVIAKLTLNKHGLHINTSPLGSIFSQPDDDVNEIPSTMPSLSYFGCAVIVLTRG